jgi:hypothetical protein
MARAAETEVLRGDDMEHDRSTPLGAVLVVCADSTQHARIFDLVHTNMANRLAHRTVLEQKPAA